MLGAREKYERFILLTRMVGFGQVLLAAVLFPAILFGLKTEENIFKHFVTSKLSITIIQAGLATLKNIHSIAHGPVLLCMVSLYGTAMFAHVDLFR